MAAKKKAKKKAKAVKKTAAKTKKAAGKAARKPAKKAARKAKKAPARKAAPKTAAKAGAASKKPKAPARKKKQIVGEGDYEATRAFDRDQANFVKRNKAKIPEMGKAAETALEGPEGDALRSAEATAAARSRDTF
jgi:hypothetical protein